MENFNDLDTAVGTEVEASAATQKKEAKKRKLQEMGTLLKETINQDPTFVQKVRSLSNSIAVINTLGFGDSGNIIVDEETKKLPKEQRKIVTTSAIVGYRVQNIGQTPIKYFTEEFAKNEDGKFVGSRVEKVLEPGAKADLTRKYMTIFCAQPEISFQLANGKIVRGSGIVKANDLEGELEAHYFTFNDKNIKVNSDTIKLNVSKAVKGNDGSKKWIVKPEFEKAFGYLNNEKSSAKKGRASSGNKFTTQDLAANYINRLLQESGL